MREGSMRAAAANALPAGRLQAAKLLVYQRYLTHRPGSLILTIMAKIVILSPHSTCLLLFPPPRKPGACSSCLTDRTLRVGWRRFREPLEWVETKKQIPLAGWCPVFLPQC